MHPSAARRVPDPADPFGPFGEVRPEAPVTPLRDAEAQRAAAQRPSLMLLSSEENNAPITAWPGSATIVSQMP